MTLRNVALLVALAETASLLIGLVSVATRYGTYAEQPLLLLQLGIGLVAQASLATFFASYYTQAGRAPSALEQPGTP
jgi:hypothetical protein